MVSTLFLGQAERAQVRRLLDRLALGRSTCAACRRQLWFIRGKAQEIVAVDDDASAHDLDCRGSRDRRRRE